MIVLVQFIIANNQINHHNCDVLIMIYGGVFLTTLRPFAGG